MSSSLSTAAAEIEAFAGEAGWDQRPTLFALVRAADLVRDEPETAARLGLAGGADDALTSVVQDELPDGPLDEVLGQLAWPDGVAGCALVQEIVVLPPGADESDPSAAAQHPQRREARLVAAVLRDGSSAVLLRLRATAGADEDLLTGPDLAPNLVAALLETLAD